MEYLKNTFGYYFTSRNNNTLKSQSIIQNNPDCKIVDCKIVDCKLKFDTQKFDNSVLNSINLVLFYKKNINTTNNDDNDDNGDECDENCECNN